MKHDHYVEIRITVARSNAKIPSVEKVWRIADWFERETYDMLGIEYIGHRDLRRILHQMIGKAGHCVRTIRSKKPITVL